MENTIGWGLSGWKLRGFACLLLAAGIAGVRSAADEPQDPAALFARAAAEYTAGASVELNAYHQEVAAISKPSDPKALDEAKQRLGECDQLLVQLKSAKQEQFDTIKLNYELTRAKLAKALKEAQ